jgi:hypothetical protein
MLYYAGIKIKEAQNLMRSFFCWYGLQRVYSSW